MTMGGNDIGFESIIQKCVMPDNCASADYKKDVFTKVAGVRSALEKAYTKVYQEANSQARRDQRDGAIAPVFVLSYPQVLPNSWIASCSSFNRSEVDFANEIVDRLNQSVAAAVAAAAAKGMAIYHVTTSQSAVLPNHTACDSDPFINPLGNVASAGWKKYVSKNAAELMHPNAAGHAAIANSLITWSQDVSYIQPTYDNPEPGPIATSSKPSAQVELDAGATEINQTVTVEAGDAVDVTVRGLAPGSTVTIIVKSTPQAVASWDADESGTAHGVAYIPLDVPSGRHSLVADGLDTEYESIAVAAALRVKPPTPGWILPLGIGSAVLLLGGIGALVWLRRTRTTATQGSAALPISTPPTAKDAVPATQ